MTQPADSAGSVQSLLRGLSVIRAFDADRPRMTLSEVAKETDLARATARRVLHTLVSIGYVGTDGREFFLRPPVLELGWSYLSSLRLPEIAQPHLEELSAQVGESCSLAILDGADVVYVARVATRRIMTVSIHVGTRFPALLTSMGRAIVATWPAAEREAFVREHLPAAGAPTDHTLTDPDVLLEVLDGAAADGYSLVDQELELGLRSMAAPVSGRDGRPVAAVNISTSAQQGSATALRAEFAEPLLRTTAAIARDLELTAH